MFCKKMKGRIKLLLQEFNTYVDRHIDTALQITTALKQMLASPAADIITVDSTGVRIDGTSVHPIKDAINAFLDDLPFNGLFVLNNLIAALQAIEGVRIGDVVSAQANYGATPYVVIGYEYTPDAGYMILDDIYFDAHVTYTAHGPI